METNITKAVVLFCTSWKGTCSDAEHYYAKYIEETYPSAVKLIVENGFYMNKFCDREELRFMPTHEQAMKLAEKDNHIGSEYVMIGDTKMPVRKLIESDAKLMESVGVSRFDSLHDIMTTAKQKFGNDGVYYLCLLGDSKETFEKVYNNEQITLK